MSDSIIIGFSRPSHLWPPPVFAWAIMLFDWSRFSHAYVRFRSDTYERDLVYQASGSKVNFIGWQRFLTKEIIVKEFEVPVTAETKKRVIQFSIDRVGTPYALWAAILGIPMVKLASLFGRRINNPFRDEGDFCSELAALILKDYLGADLTYDDVRRMTPTDVYDYLLKSVEV